MFSNLFLGNVPRLWLSFGPWKLPSLWNVTFSFYLLFPFLFPSPCYLLFPSLFLPRVAMGSRGSHWASDFQCKPYLFAIWGATGSCNLGLRSGVRVLPVLPWWLPLCLRLGAASATSKLGFKFIQVHRGTKMHTVYHCITLIRIGENLLCYLGSMLVFFSLLVFALSRAGKTLRKPGFILVTTSTC